MKEGMEMEFKDLVQEHVRNIRKIENDNLIEEQTKMYMIAPFLNLMGYNVFNPEDVVAEYTADIGSKKGEKVDYALKIKGNVEILIEAKAKNDNLENHDIQLKRYFNVTNAKVGILTNGIVYKFFTDLEKTNIMDNKPFLIINLFDLTDEKIEQLKKFTKSYYDITSVTTSAESLKYANGIKLFLNEQLENPSDAFIKLIGKEIYSGKLTQIKIEELRSIFKETFKTFINDFARKKFESVLDDSSNVENKEEVGTVETVDPKKEVITTEEELECYYVIKSILRKHIDSARIYYRDNLSYFNILLDDSNRKWICRIYITANGIKLLLPTDSNKIDLESINDLYNYEKELIEIVESF